MNIKTSLHKAQKRTKNHRLRTEKYINVKVNKPNDTNKQVAILNDNKPDSKDVFVGTSQALFIVSSQSIYKYCKLTIRSSIY